MKWGNKRGPGFKKKERKKESKKKGGGGVRVDEEKLEECQHHWFNLGRTRGKGRDPIKITLGW